MTRIAKIVKQMQKIMTHMDGQKPYQQAKSLLVLKECVVENESYLNKKARGLYNIRHIKKPMQPRKYRLQLKETEDEMIKTK